MAELDRAAEAVKVDHDDPLWMRRARAVELEPELRHAPPEYLEVLPWTVDGQGEQWIHARSLTEWCDGQFAAHASEVIRQAADADWRQRRAQR